MTSSLMCSSYSRKTMRLPCPVVRGYFRRFLCSEHSPWHFFFPTTNCAVQLSMAQPLGTLQITKLSSTAAGRQILTSLCLNYITPFTEVVIGAQLMGSQTGPLHISDLFQVNCFHCNSPISSTGRCIPLLTVISFLLMRDMSVKSIFSSALHNWQEKRLDIKPSPVCFQILHASTSLPACLLVI